MAQEIKKTASVPAVGKAKKETLAERFRGIRVEMKKVIWPTRKELLNYTIVVIVVCAFFALAFWALDMGFLAALKAALGITLS